MSKCALCKKPMGTGTKLRYIIDWDDLKIIGSAHTGCVQKLNKYKDTRYYPYEIPTTEQIQYAKTLKHEIETFEKNNNDRIWDKQDFHKYLLATEGLFKASSTEEFLKMPRVLTLTDWWLNGSKIKTQEEIDEIFNWMRNLGDKPQ